MVEDGGVAADLQFSWPLVADTPYVTASGDPELATVVVFAYHMANRVAQSAL